MSWPTLDDAAPLHVKQLRAGPVACWFWICCLCYCERQEAKDGFIPDAVVKLLYPRLGPKEAGRLVSAGLLERVEDGYQLHEYSAWRDRRFGDTQGKRGSAGGRVSSDAKRQAALSREHNKRLARDHNEPQRRPQRNDHNETAQNHKPSDPIRSDETCEVVAEDSSGLPAREVSPEPPPPPRDFSRFQQKPRLAGRPPEPRTDELFERFSWRSWAPSQQFLDWFREAGLTDRDVDSMLTECRDKLTGMHDVGWFDVKVLRFAEVAIDRKRTPRSSPGDGNQSNADDAAFLVRAKRGEYGKKIQAEANEGAAVAGLRLAARARAEAAGLRPATREPTPVGSALAAALGAAGKGAA